MLDMTYDTGLGLLLQCTEWGSSGAASGQMYFFKSKYSINLQKVSVDYVLQTE
jgi:hypothetical protein